eukprot:scaffold136541_cov28-Tisochrysis_lutea.AAC.3
MGIIVGVVAIVNCVGRARFPWVQLRQYRICLDADDLPHVSAVPRECLADLSAHSDVGLCAEDCIHVLQAPRLVGSNGNGIT